MARRRLQQKGDLRAGSGWWRLRWRLDSNEVIGYKKNGEPRYNRPWSETVIVGPAPGNKTMAPLTKREAQRAAWEQFLSKLAQNDITPRSAATVAQFVDQKFLPDHVSLKRKNTREHYVYLLNNFVLPAIGSMKLQDVKRDHVQRLASQIVAKGLSVQTAMHVLKTVSAIFSMAEDFEWSKGNPSRRIKLPEMTRKFRAALTWPQVQEIAGMLKAPYGSLIMVLAQTGMRIGELVGLKWKWVNLSDQTTSVDGYWIPGYTILVRENWTAGEWQVSPKGKRIRQIPMTSTVWVELATRREKAGEVAPDSLVYPNEDGNPLDAHNLAARYFKPAVRKIGLPWACLHCLRHTMATMADQAKLTMRERMDLLGHRDERTAMGYAHSDLERIREKLDEAEVQTRKERVN